VQRYDTIGNGREKSPAITSTAEGHDIELNQVNEEIRLLVHGDSQQCQDDHWQQEQ
jgi:ABC-type uncharacterized transport system involved in gliding motility auxiliary subunit